MKVGVSTLHARAVMPTVSSPNWASMIMEAEPEQHAITTDDWKLNKFEIRPTVVGSGGTFPTIHLNHVDEAGYNYSHGTSQDDSSFELVSPSGDGAPPGKYKVLVSWPVDSLTVDILTEAKIKKKGSNVDKQRKNKLDTLTKDKLKERYFNADTPLITVEVKVETIDLGLLEIKE
jgi:hypothetical protein